MLWVRVIAAQNAEKLLKVLSEKHAAEKRKKPKRKSKYLRLGIGFKMIGILPSYVWPKTLFVEPR